MLVQLLVGLALVGASAIVQAFFMMSGFTGLQALRPPHRDLSPRRATVLIVLFVLYMFLAMLVQIGIWAAAYVWLGALSTFEEALYVSSGSFTTIGYGADPLPFEWRLLVGIEGANGMLVLGWAAAIVVAAIQHLHVWPEPRKPRGDASR
jgi:hypothetical protein